MTDASVSWYAASQGQEAVAATGEWAFDGAFGPRLTVEPTRTMWHLAGLAVILAVSSLTSVSDPWFEGAQQRAQSSVGNGFDAVRPRRISIAQARRVALDALRRAEQERLRMAQEEAERGIDWEGET